MSEKWLKMGKRQSREAKMESSEWNEQKPHISV